MAEHTPGRVGFHVWNAPATRLSPMQTLFESKPNGGVDLPLPPELLDIYGYLTIPHHPGRPYLIGNFVSSLDGVVSLNTPGKSGGDEISGFNTHDQMVMGLLRACADAVIIGAGTLESAGDHLWTPDAIYPALADEYRALRNALGKAGQPLTAIVTASGAIGLNHRVFQDAETPVLIVTSAEGAKSLREREIPSGVRVAVVEGDRNLSCQGVIDAVRQTRWSDTILVEGGPHLMGSLLDSQCIDDLFLTVSPQVAGRDGHAERPGFVAGQTFAPDLPLWATLVSVKRAGNHLFLRYRFESTDMHGSRGEATA